MRHRATPGQWHDQLAYQSWVLVHHDDEPLRHPARTGQQSVRMGHTAGRPWDRAGRTCCGKSVINDRLIAAVIGVRDRRRCVRWVVVMYRFPTSIAQTTWCLLGRESWVRAKLSAAFAESATAGERQS